MNNAHQYILADCKQIYQWKKSRKPERIKLPIYSHSHPIHQLGSIRKQWVYKLWSWWQCFHVSHLGPVFQ